jgi:hypothetical protein
LQLKYCHPQIVEEYRRAWQTVRHFVNAAKMGDLDALVSTPFEDLDQGAIHGAGWPAAMRAISRLGSVPNKTRRAFLRLYVRYGDHLRQEAGDDIALINGFRSLLPPYTGPAVRLYRGQGALKPRKRSIGMAWTASREVAESFAQGDWQLCDDGSVLLATLAPPDAIICRVSRTEDRYGEAEYLVDRRRLHQVTVVAKYAHVPFRERHPQAPSVDGLTAESPAAAKPFALKVHRN